MIRELFQDAEPVYVAVRAGTLVINDLPQDKLQVSIQDILPVRKLFRDRKLACFSTNGRTGKNGRYCALCQDRYRCRQRIRLMMLVHNLDSDPTPAVLEIAPPSFDALDELLERVPRVELADTLVTVAIDRTVTNATVLQFSPVF
ncbi:hypothetical protein H8E07_18475 [bacterium]|nr:hypothetical protein [bacterium]